MSTEPELPEGMPDGLNFPFDEAAVSASELIAAGALIFQKFTCGSCGNRLTMGEPNKFYTQGSCDQCGHVTDIRETGCNYLCVWPVAPITEEVLNDPSTRSG
jgi:predicted RNA-binding Zn-ribbon protein involved in translation (DUF1610 family)